MRCRPVDVLVVAALCGALVLLWRPGPAAAGAGLDFPWRPEPAVAEATLGLRPYLQEVREDRAVIAWSVPRRAGRGEVEISPDGETWRRVASVASRLTAESTGLAQDVFLHRAEAGELAPGTAYFYRVLMDGVPVAGAQRDGWLSFRTPGSERFRFVALGDSGDGGPVQVELAGRMSGEAADFVLHAGDLAYEDGSFQQFEEFFFGVYGDLLSGVPVYAAPGNHEFYSRDGAAFRALLPRRARSSEPPGGGLSYSFDWGPAHVAVIDSNEPLVRAAQGDEALLKWLDEDLKAARGRWLIAMFHHTPYPISHHKDSDAAGWARRLLTPILERHGVHLVLNGHEHLYMRSKPLRGGQAVEEGWGTVYVTTGGGGAVLHAAPEENDPFVEASASAPHYLRVAVSGTEMCVQAVGQRGEVIDEFALKAGARLAPGGVANAAGGLASITGRDLAWAAAEAVPPLPESLGGVTVRLNGAPLRLVSVRRDRVVVQLRADVAGPAELELTGPNGTVRAAILVAEGAPEAGGRLSNAAGIPVR